MWVGEGVRVWVCEVMGVRVCVWVWMCDGVRVCMCESEPIMWAYCFYW